ncbi:MAG TPA: pseudouridine synthase [Mariprofundaceae bacterium]|nr:pseudouridine synthase [Mariprofundaceae bacterium]
MKSSNPPSKKPRARVKTKGKGKAKALAAGKPAARALKDTQDTQENQDTSSDRINRYMARCGLCSRREADRWIEAGRVAVNGKIVRQPGVIIGPGDTLSVDGKPVSRQTSFTYMLYNKPTGQLCSRLDAKGRPLIYDKLDVAPNVQSVGRLDMNTEGLLLLTDDGALARALTHPSARLPREYRVRVAGQVSLETLQKIRQGGIDIGEGETSEPWEATVDSETAGHTWLTIVINRGRNREVRRTLEAAGHPVRRLMRTAFGPIRMDETMPRGLWRPLTSGEVKQLRHFIKDDKHT